MPQLNEIQTKKTTKMDFLKKNVTWIAVIALGISVYLYWQMNKKETDEDKTGFVGKLDVNNPLNR